MKATVSEDGRVTIPKALRDRLGIESGAVLDFEEESGRLIAVPAANSPLSEARPTLREVMRMPPARREEFLRNACFESDDSREWDALDAAELRADA